MVVETYLDLRAQLGASLHNLLPLADHVGASNETIQNIRNLLSGLDQPFLFVVVGEVKAGKSSLLNALFGAEFLKVDVLPATDRIYVFKYAQEAHDIQISENLVERFQPIEFLRNFNIVDTPGTNTIVANHQEITERFVPMADLIIFVFSVTNPWAASAWNFLKLLGNQWRKNIVFVVQQADLRDFPEVATIVRHLEQTILQMLGASCPVYAVSAKKALAAKITHGPEKDELWRQSNFGPLEDWIQATVIDSNERGSKLRSIAQTTLVFIDNLKNRIQAALDLLKSDQDKLASIRSSFDARKEQTQRQIGGFIREIERAYDGCRERGEALLEDRLTVGQTFKMIFSGGRWEKDFQDQVEADVKKEVQTRIEQALTLLENDLRAIWQNLQEQVSIQFEAESKKQVRAATPGFLTQRQVVLQRLQLTLFEQMSDARIKQQLQSLFGETARWLRVPTSVAAAGGVATIIAALTHTAILDFTGTVAGIAALTGTLYAVWRRRKILREYRVRMDEKREELARAMETQLRHAIDAFYLEVSQV
ncbi:MAG: dynamin family protein, partial [Verrucomicrobia bacterium]|nr:dynamin family protein [Verrucomicrobiota bacterium]